VSTSLNFSKRPDLTNCALLLGKAESLLIPACLLSVLPLPARADQECAAAITNLSERAANAHQSDDETEVAPYEKATGTQRRFAPSLTLCISN
jgi:hypothetical protein